MSRSRDRILHLRHQPLHILRELQCHPARFLSPPLHKMCPEEKNRCGLFTFRIQGHFCAVKIGGGKTEPISNRHCHQNTCHQSPVQLAARGTRLPQRVQVRQGASYRLIRAFNTFPLFLKTIRAQSRCCIVNQISQNRAEEGSTTPRVKIKILSE